MLFDFYFIILNSSNAVAGKYNILFVHTTYYASEAHFFTTSFIYVLA